MRYLQILFKQGLILPSNWLLTKIKKNNSQDYINDVFNQMINLTMEPTHIEVKYGYITQLQKHLFWTAQNFYRCAPLKSFVPSTLYFSKLDMVLTKDFCTIFQPEGTENRGTRGILNLWGFCTDFLYIFIRNK